MAPLGRVPKRPSIRPEKEWSEAFGGCLVAGIDEAGRGPLAGPVVAACVVWEFDKRRPTGLGDSKQLLPDVREKLFLKIQRHALTWGIGVADNTEIDLHNILEATRIASARAFQAACGRVPGCTIGGLVTDCLEIPALALPTRAMIKGDCHSASVAAASILAKVTRDRLMDVYAQEFPGYGWETNRGYPTPEHYDALERLGPTSLHRMSFNGVGFFDTQPRRSATYTRLARLCEATPAHPDALISLRQQIESARDRLPPLDLGVLLEAAEARARQSGIEIAPAPTAAG